MLTISFSFFLSVYSDSIRFLSILCVFFKSIHAKQNFQEFRTGKLVHELQFALLNGVVYDNTFQIIFLFLRNVIIPLEPRQNSPDTGICHNISSDLRTIEPQNSWGFHGCKIINVEEIIIIAQKYRCWLILYCWFDRSRKVNKEKKTQSREKLLNESDLIHFNYAHAIFTSFNLFIILVPSIHCYHNLYYPSAKTNRTKP